MDYRQGQVYRTLEGIIENAGIKVEYGLVPDDAIDGAIWARADADRIMMPLNGDAFPDEETACVILGHEAGHILSRLDSVDAPAERRKNEAVCDLVGCYLYELAIRTFEHQMELAMKAGGV